MCANGLAWGKLQATYLKHQKDLPGGPLALRLT